mmetsp:Transcript_25162/g.63845  ORF Transcript_25162/g.63845 Transcript_25162/m.63845 type:complete len:415 (-) Transcript_25162:10-1254(-)
MASWRLAALLLAAPALNAQDAPETCDAGDEQCQREGPLRWRGFPYMVTHPAYAKTIYGGGFVKESFAASGFEGPVEGDDWHVLWTHRPQDRKLPPLPALTRPGQRLVNHCNYYAAAGDKCAFTRHAETVFRKDPGSPLHGKPYLRSFELTKPEELERWRREVEAAPTKSWVLKPCSAGASKGIEVARGAGALEVQRRMKSSTIAQEYLERPFRGFGDRKFHMRLFVLMPRYEPVAAYLYGDGLVFRSTHEAKRGDLPSAEKDVFSSLSDSVVGSRLEDLWRMLDAHPEAPVPSATVRERINEVLSGLLGTRLQESFGSYQALEQRRGFGCFDLFGADVLLDERLQPMVMEINVGPNMWVDNHGKENVELLSAIKRPMVQQVAHWAALRSSREEVTDEQAAAMEAKALVNFTRIL